MASDLKNKTNGVPKLTLANIIGYGCGDAGGVITLYAVSGFMTRYLQVHLAVNPVLLASILLIWNAWDAINDPLMGTIMDMVYTKAKPGADKFRPWILASIPVMAVGLITFYAVPSHLGGGFAMMASIFVLKIIYEGGYTMMNIGMGSLLGAMATNDNERATLASARGFGSTIGGMIAGAIIPQILAKFGDNTTGFAVMGVVCAVLGCFIVFLHYALTKERNKAAQLIVDEEDAEKQKFKITDIWNIITKNRAFLALVLHSISICAVQALGQGAATYMVADVLHDIGIQSVGSIFSSVAMIVILASAPILTKKWDLVVIIRTCLAAGFVCFVGLLAYVFFAPGLSPMLYILWMGLATAFVTMSVQMQWGLVAESIDYNEYITGKRNPGTIYGFFSLSRRIGGMIANSLSVLLIAGIGYDPTLTQAGLEQSAGTIAGIKWMVVGFPCLAAVASFCCFTFIWNINGDVRAKMAAWKEERAAKIAAAQAAKAGE